MPPTCKGNNTMSDDDWKVVRHRKWKRRARRTQELQEEHVLDDESDDETITTEDESQQNALPEESKHGGWQRSNHQISPRPRTPPWRRTPPDWNHRASTWWRKSPRSPDPRRGVRYECFQNRFSRGHMPPREAYRLEARYRIENLAALLLSSHVQKLLANGWQYNSVIRSTRARVTRWEKIPDDTPETVYHMELVQNQWNDLLILSCARAILIAQGQWSSKFEPES